MYNRMHIAHNVAYKLICFAGYISYSEIFYSLGGNMLNIHFHNTTNRYVYSNLAIVGLKLYKIVDKICSKFSYVSCFLY